MIKYRCAGSKRKNLEGVAYCDYTAERPWIGRCPQCQRFYDCLRSGHEPEDRSKMTLAALASKPIERISTGIPEFDHVLNGGLVRGSTTLLTGAPGTGKSTLLIQTSDGVAKGKRSVLYTSGEQSAHDIGELGGRLGASNVEIDVLGNEGDIYKIIGHAEKKKPTVLVVDSVNTAFVDDIDSDVNSSRQIEACGNYLVSYGKTEGVALIVVCHQTKGGEMAGPRALEHLVDTVIYFDPVDPDEGDDEEEVASLRVLVSGKNRHGPTGRRSVLEMTEQGLRTPSRRKSSLIVA